jgi:chemotaxis methyl-accepting protein methylase/mannose-6-phosphate isomerase-like protein (cupin superfamily)
MPYTYSLPDTTSFTGKGLLGYTFGPLNQKDLEIYYIEVEKGHDIFMISKKITRTYYVISGSGYFTIDGHKYDISPGMLIEIPPRIEYCYSGKMKLVAISKPRWFSGNDTVTKWNPDVVRSDYSLAIERLSWLTRLVRLRVLGKSPVNAYLQVNHRLWMRLPSSLTNLGPIRSYGDFLHKIARMQGSRAQALATLFFRNRPELELIRRLLAQVPEGGTLRVAVLGCSAGAEAYSVAWRIRSARPDIRLTLDAVDISKQAVEFAKCGVYSLALSELTGTQMFECMTADEVNELFHQEGERATVKSWIKEGINWHVGDAGDPEIVDILGQHDMVVANNFLCHMEPEEAERCLRNIADLVSPHGYLFVSGVDLDVRAKVANDRGWEPLQELLEEIHDGDSYLRRYWPGMYAGLEPLNKGRRDWRIRYAAAYQVAPATGVPLAREENELCNA